MLAGVTKGLCGALHYTLPYPRYYITLYYRRVWHEENFGPVVAVIAFDTEDEARYRSARMSPPNR